MEKQELGFESIEDARKAREKEQDSPRKKRAYNTDPFLTVREAAEDCRVGIDLIYERIRNGTLQAYRFGGKSTRIRLSTLRAWFESVKTEPRRPRSRAIL